MSEMSAEKKKEIEKYIIKSYFGGGKNVESLANGADIIKGTDDGYIPQLIVEVTYFGESGIVMIKWNIYGDSQQNSFSMHICREREIERNRCDSVDAMAYAWESWRERIQGKPIFLKTNDEDLQKVKRIKELEREIKALRAENEVMDRHIQELEARNVSLDETNNDKKGIEFSMHSMMATHKSYEDHTEIAITGTIPDREIFAASNPFDIPCDVVVVPKREFERLQTENEELKQKLHEFDPIPDYKECLAKLYSTEDVEKLEWTLNHICGGRASVNGWMASAKFWKQNCQTISKLVGFSSTEEIQDYLTNEAKCDTLQEAIVKLIDANKRVCEEWCSANSSNNSWKAAAECNSPKELIEKLNLLRDDISGRSTVIESYKRDIEKWQTVTGYSTPEDYLTAKIRTVYVKLEPSNVTWRDATGCDTPEEAKSRIEGLENAVRQTDKTMLGVLEMEIDTWQKATGCDTPGKVESKINELKTQVRNLNDRLGGFIQAASCAEKHLEHVLVWKSEQTGQEIE